MALGSRELRLQAVKRQLVEAKTPEGFKDETFVVQSDISLGEEILVGVFFLVVMGGPLALVISFFWLLVWGSWLQLALHVAISLLLAFHPVPAHSPDNVQNGAVRFLSRAVFRYFSYRYMYSGDAWEVIRQGPAWIGASPPHGALPVANLLCMPAINIATRRFVGAPASVVFNTPFLRYILLLGSCGVSGNDMCAAVEAGDSVGMSPDGIAGIFTSNPDEEVVALKRRMGLAKLMLRTGVSLLPAYSIGNTAAFGVWYDRWGIMEALSRKLRVSLFIPYGRFLLPIPFRANLTMVFGKPIRVEKVAEPIPREKIEELHNRILDEITTLFNTHKGAVGWGKKTLKWV